MLRKFKEDLFQDIEKEIDLKQYATQTDLQDYIA